MIIVINGIVIIRVESKYVSQLTIMVLSIFRWTDGDSEGKGTKEIRVLSEFPLNNGDLMMYN